MSAYVSPFDPSAIQWRVSELEMELRVRPHPELANREHLPRREAGAGEIDGPAEDGERDGEDEHVRRDGRRPAAGVEAERVGAARGPPDGGELGPGRDLAAQFLRKPGRDLVVPAANVVLLVRLAEDTKLPLAHEAEQVEEVQRALLGRVGSVLDRVGDVEQPAEARPHPIRDRLLDPVDDREPVELASALRGAVEERGIAGGRDVLVDLLPHLLEVVGDLGLRVGGRAKAGAHLGSVRLGAEQVVELEAELLREVADRLVALIDQLAAVLGDLPVRERAANRPASAADAVRRVEHLTDVAGLS